MGNTQPVEANIPAADPSDLSKILDDESLWLSSHHCARDKDLLLKTGISHIVAITHEEAIHYPDKVHKKKNKTITIFL